MATDDCTEMQPQQPAEGILKIHDWGNSKVYKVVCTCGDPDHSVDLAVEADELGVTVTHYTTEKTNFWYEDITNRYPKDAFWYTDVHIVAVNVWNGFVRRVKLTYDIWFKGYAEYQQSTMMTKQQALNYAETLKSAINDVEKFQQEIKGKP